MKKFQIKKYDKIFSNSLNLLFLSYLVWLLHPLFTGGATGTLRHSDLPQEYVQVKNFIVSQNFFYRVLWVPVPPKYVYYSDLQRSISAEELLATYNQYDLLNKLKEKSTEKLLQEANVKYVLVPYDSEKQIYITDRKYDEKKYQQVVTSLDSLSWLRRIKTFGKVIVYQVPAPKDHFWISSKQSSDRGKISYQQISKVEYKIFITNATKDDRLVFSEGYDNGWVAKEENTNIMQKSIIYDGLFNSFILPQNGDYTMDIYYTPQKWVDIGFEVSLVTGVILAGSLIFFKKRIKED